MARPEDGTSSDVVATVPVTVVTVVFRAELALLRLQARSLAALLDADMVDEVVVIDNSWPRLGRRARARITQDYGRLADRVRFLLPGELAVLPTTTGWRSQQILKLVVARHVRSDRYLLLDAKNHLIRPATAADLQAADGRARGATHSYVNHPLRPQLEHTLTYLGLDPAPLIRDFPPTATPFVMDTVLVRRMLDDVESRSGRTFAEEFERAGLMEFFLYSGWLRRNGIGHAALYDGSALESPTVWPRLADRAGVVGCIDEAMAHDAAFFAVHRSSLNRLDGPAVDALAQLWTSRGIFRDQGEVRRFIRSFRCRYYRDMTIKKVRELPARRRLARSAV